MQTINKAKLTTADLVQCGLFVSLIIAGAYIKIMIPLEPFSVTFFEAGSMPDGAAAVCMGNAAAAEVKRHFNGRMIMAEKTGLDGVAQSILAERRTGNKKCLHQYIIIKDYL